MARIARRLTLGAALLLVAAAALSNPATAQNIADAQAVLAAKEWVAPPSQIADAVLAPRHLNVTLTNVSPDRQRFFDEVGDGPVRMERFATPFDELGGQFYDRQANRARVLTTRSSVGINIISAEDGSVTEVEVPRGSPDLQRNVVT